MSTPRFPKAWLLVALAGGVSLGCGGKYESYVSGEVTLDGAPLSTGTVTFAPVAGGATAHGSIDAGGDYTLRTGLEEGLDSGKYRVMVVARERPASDYGPNGGPPPAGKQITPEWYRSPDMSGLQFEVEQGGNDIDLTLSSEPPPGWDPRRARGRR